MYKFSNKSLSKLKTVEPDLQKVFEEAIKNSPLDFAITSGLRTAEEQNILYKNGKSQRDGYNVPSLHQTGCAIDIAVYGLDGSITWEKEYYYMVAGHIIGIAKSMGITLVWGGIWPNFKDYVHFQLER